MFYKNIANERKVNDFIICRVQLYFLQKYKKLIKQQTFQQIMRQILIKSADKLVTLPHI